MGLNYKSSLTRYRRYLSAVEDNNSWRASIFTIFSLGLLLVMIIFALRPTMLTIADLVTQIKEQKVLSERLAEKIDTVRAASEVLNRQKERLTLADQALPQSPEWISWVQTVEAAAAEAGVEVDQINAGPIDQQGKLPTIQTNQVANGVPVTLPPGAEQIRYTIKVHARYDQVRMFAEKLEQLRRITVIDQLQYGKDEDGAILASVEGWIAYMAP